MAKRAKADVHYGPGKPHCGVCTHFRDEDASGNGACELVEGKINEDMWCELFKDKRKATLAEGYAR